MAIGLQMALVNHWNRLPSVREMQCQLLVSLSGTEGIATAAGEHIRGLAGGQTRHRYAALSLGFRFAVEERRRNPSAGTASLTVPSPVRPTLQRPDPGSLQWGPPRPPRGTTWGRGGFAGRGLWRSPNA